MEVTGYTDAETWEFVHIVGVAVAAFDEVPPNPADGIVHIEWKKRPDHI